MEQKQVDEYGCFAIIKENRNAAVRYNETGVRVMFSRESWSTIRLGCMRVRQRFSFRRRMNSKVPFGWKRTKDASTRRACGGFFAGHNKGTTINIIADGVDEEEAVYALVELVKSNFAE